MAVQEKNSWAHSCCTEKELANAISNDDIKYIESDIIISSRTGLPVMAHPPATDSDLTFETFMQMAAPSGKGIKLDFKHQLAVLPCLQLTSELEKEGVIRSDQTIWLNADIIPGPGGSPSSVTFEPSTFIETCTRVYPKGVLSLGWKVDLSQGNAHYTQEHCDEMLMLVKKYGLQVKRLVFAVAARPCALNTRHLKDLLRKLPLSELLIWTGTGEPAISVSLVKYLQTEFEEFTMNISSNITSSSIPSRIAYDVNIANGYMDSSLSESQLFIHRFIHRLDDFNHFFIIKFLNFLPGSSSVVRKRGDKLKLDDESDDGIEEGDVEMRRAAAAAGLAALNRSVESPTEKAMRVMKQTFWISFFTTSGFISLFGLIAAKKIFFKSQTQSTIGDDTSFDSQGSKYGVSTFLVRYNPFIYLFSLFDGSTSNSSRESDGSKVALGAAVGSALLMNKRRKSRK